MIRNKSLLTGFAGYDMSSLSFVALFRRCVWSSCGGDANMSTINLCIAKVITKNESCGLAVLRGSAMFRAYYLAMFMFREDCCLATRVLCADNVASLSSGDMFRDCGCCLATLGFMFIFCYLDTLGSHVQERLFPRYARMLCYVQVILSC